MNNNNNIQTLIKKCKEFNTATTTFVTETKNFLKNLNRILHIHNNTVNSIYYYFYKNNEGTIYYALKLDFFNNKISVVKKDIYSDDFINYDECIDYKIAYELVDKFKEIINYFINELSKKYDEAKKINEKLKTLTQEINSITKE